MALVALLAAGCGSGGSSADRTTGEGSPESAADTAQDLVFLAPPSLRENPAAGLTAWLELETSVPASLSLRVAVGSRSWPLSAPVAERHRVLILGLRPEEEVRVEVVAEAGAGRRLEGSASWVAPPLPDDLRPLTVLASDPARMEPGVTVLTAPGGYLTLVDPDGTPCWYVRYPELIREVGLWPGPRIGVVGARRQLDELDLSGALLRRWGTERAPPPRIPVDAFATHHDLRWLPGGNLLTLDVERRWMLHPTSETDPAAPWAEAWVAGDVVLELAPDGSTVARWPLLDRLDPTRVGRGSITGDFWEGFGEWSGDDIHDWAHANSVSLDPAGETVLVSLRHQDAVVGLSRATGALEWILGHPAQWEPPWSERLLRPDPAPPGFRWHWHQHAAQWTPSGTIVMFDNGNFGAPAFEEPLPDRVSRAVEVRVRPDLGTFEVLWSWGDELGLYAPSLGDADVLPLTDHVLLTFGSSDPPDGPARVVEVTRAGEVVWQAASAPGETWFRSGRWTGVIPGEGR